MEGKGGSFRDYLARAIGENRSWARIFKEIVVADVLAEENKGAELFLKSRVRDLDRLANDVSVRLFGVNISCAQCHDHPLVPSWKQDHYFGMKSFFSRTFENGDFLAEREYGYVSFKTTAGENKQANLMFLTGAPIQEPECPEPNGEAKKQERQRLLARDLVRHNYELRRVIRGFVLSEAYARSSRWSEQERPDAALFAVAIPRPLTPQQLAASLQIAGAHPDKLRADAPDLDKTFEGIEKQTREWETSFDRPSDNFQVSAEEALLFSNSAKVQQALLSESEGTLMLRLGALQDRQAIIRAAIWNVLSRAPDSDESRLLDDYLARRSDRPTAGIRQVLWALLTSTEFRFNH